MSKVMPQAPVTSWLVQLLLVEPLLSKVVEQVVYRYSLHHYYLLILLLDLKFEVVKTY